MHGDCRAADGQAVCDCDSGYIALGLVCHADYCAELVCAHGRCVQNAEVGACECDPGWTGVLCDACAEGYHPDNGDCLADAPCDSSPCVHGSCRVEAGEEVCDCEPGYDGALCDGCAEGYHAEGLSCVPDENNPCVPNPGDE